MNFLESIFGNDREVEKDYGNFVNRYEQGSPSEGYSDQEVYDRYQNVSKRLPPDLYQESAQEAFSRMTPQERMEFGRYLQQQTRQQNLNFPDLNQDGIDDRFQDPRPNCSSNRSNSIFKGLIYTGQIFKGASGMIGGQGGNIMSNPLAKGAMAGIAALAVKKLMNQGGRQGNNGQYGDIRPASLDPLGDPADQPYRY